MGITARIACLLLPCLGAIAAAERINHEGRILGPLPVVTAPILFDTPEADAVVSAMQVMPRDSAWNEDVSALPVAANSAAMIARIKADVGALAANRQRLVAFREMNYVLVPDTQPLANIDFQTYPDESDDLLPLGPGNDPRHIGSWPLAANLPVEGWPSEQSALTDAQWQQDAGNVGGDRHTITVMPGAGFIWETWSTRLTDGLPAWTAANGAKFPLASNTPRPDGWTSGDAAGLPMFPALVRYDEIQRGVVEHALRIVVAKSSHAYIYPATHQAGNSSDPDAPAMGQRLRLRSSFVIPASWSQAERAVAVALKKYGALVADNGGFFSISITPDDRWATSGIAFSFDHFSTAAASDALDISDFEVVTATGATGGPRGGTAPTADAGADQGILLGNTAVLSGAVSGSGVTAHWDAYPGAPGTVTFGDASLAATTATFSVAGVYTLRLKASDGIHTPAYDAVMVTVRAANNPVPSLTSINPVSRIQYSGGFTLTLNGANIASDAHVTWTGQPDLTGITGGPAAWTIAVPASYLASAPTASNAIHIKVVNPAPGGGTSAGEGLFTITTDGIAPVITGTLVSGIGANFATITWTTSEAATTQVDYGTAPSYGTVATSAGLVTSHSVTLSGLTPNTQYHFRVRSVDGAGNAAVTADSAFTTGFTNGGSSTGTGSIAGGGGCGLGGAAAILLLVGVGLRRRRRV